MRGSGCEKLDSNCLKTTASKLRPNLYANDASCEAGYMFVFTDCLQRVDKPANGKPSICFTIVEHGCLMLLAFTRMLLGAKGIATRSNDATRGSWPYY